MKRVSDILVEFNPLEEKYISREFQAYGIYLAEQLSDIRHKSLYIKLAKEVPRVVLDEALNFVKAAGDTIRSRPRLFMWRLKDVGALGKKKRQKKWREPLILSYINY